MTQRQIKLVENYIRRKVRKALSENKKSLNEVIEPREVAKRVMKSCKMYIDGTVSRDSFIAGLKSALKELSI